MNLTATLRQRLQHDLPLDDLLPDELPAYVHIVILPVIVSALVGLHLLLVRMRGVVRPYPAPGEEVHP